MVDSMIVIMWAHTWLMAGESFYFFAVDGV